MVCLRAQIRSLVTIYGSSLADLSSATDACAGTLVSHGLSHNELYRTRNRGDSAFIGQRTQVESPRVSSWRNYNLSVTMLGVTEPRD